MSADVDLERLAQRGIAEGLSDEEILELFADHGVDQDTAENTLASVKEQASVNTERGLDDLDDFDEPQPEDTSDDDLSLAAVDNTTDDEADVDNDEDMNFEEFNKAFDDVEDEEESQSVFSKLTSWFSSSADDEDKDELDDLELEPTEQDDQRPVQDTSPQDDEQNLATDTTEQQHNTTETTTAEDTKSDDDLKQLAREARKKGLNDDDIITLFTDHGITEDKAHTLLNAVNNEDKTDQDTTTTPSSDSPTSSTPSTTPNNDEQPDDDVTGSDALRKLAREGIEKGLNDDELIAFFTNNGLTEDQAIAIIEDERDRPIQRSTENKDEPQPQNQQAPTPDQPAEGEVNTVGKARHKHRGNQNDNTEERDAINVQKEASYTKNEGNVTTTTTQQSADGSDAYMAGMDKDKESLEVGRVFLTGRKPSYGRMHVSGLSDLVDREVKSQGRTGFIDLSGSDHDEDDEPSEGPSDESTASDLADLDMSDKVSSRTQELREIAEEVS